VREVTGNFSTYWKEYQLNHKELHRWVLKGNRPYRDSVATTWSLSFNTVRENDSNASDLLGIFSYLNPDGILIDFLRDGAKSLDDGLSKMISDSVDMATALLDLESFSLIKWDRRRRTLIIHRLVQVAVKEEMSESEQASTLTAVINLCNAAFPGNPTETGQRNLCRIYFSQAVPPLRQGKIVQTREFVALHCKIGHFHFHFSNFIESEKHCRQAIQDFVEIAGRDAPETLEAMRLLPARFLND